MTISAPRPGVRPAPALDFPDIERARLSNGIQVVYARRTAVPVTRVAVEFDAGIAADPADRLGTQAMMLDLLEEGTTSLNSTQLAEAQERLGATIGDRRQPRPHRGHADRDDAGARRRRSTCSPTSSAIRPSSRARSSGSASSSSPASPPS